MGGGQFSRGMTNPHCLSSHPHWCGVCDCQLCHFTRVVDYLSDISLMLASPHRFHSSPSNGDGGIRTPVWLSSLQRSTITFLFSREKSCECRLGVLCQDHRECL